MILTDPYIVEFTCNDPRSTIAWLDENLDHYEIAISADFRATGNATKVVVKTQTKEAATLVKMFCHP